VIFDLDSFKAVVHNYGDLVSSRTIAQIGPTVAGIPRPAASPAISAATSS
jgi:hypothetical protein